MKHLTAGGRTGSHNSNVPALIPLTRKGDKAAWLHAGNPSRAGWPPSEWCASGRSALRYSTIVLLLFAGCARFSTVQTDIRYDIETGQKITEITTRASGTTFFSARSDLATWKASQTEGQQGAEVGGLSQQGGTNAVATLDALGKVLGALPK